ncbi:MAG: indole-3-glycerol phosphate synthase TrpC [Clostridiales bacterium]|jgi:indole-3-glycerol phosphate synthase|nr:indole-3-glycerol phosphate synthase TrpC [Clostridiales bacterium]
MILDKITKSVLKRVEDLKREIPLNGLIDSALSLPVSADFPFEKALKKDGLSFICEIKKASPSKGVIAPDFPYLKIAGEYAAAGADVLSVLTEPEFFLGSGEYLREISGAVPLPALRKDFIIDEYQIYEAKTLGASAVLLICAILDGEKLRRFLKTAEALGMSALVEAHTEDEIFTALSADAEIVGVNNRDLKTFEVDLNVCARLRRLVPRDVLFVAESGIKTRGDVNFLENIGADAVLIGEGMMTAANKEEYLAGLKGVKRA